MNPAETRKLSSDELKNIFRPLFEHVHAQLERASGGDGALLWALRRKLAKELGYDEREKPAKRQRLKRQKRREQDGKCSNCGSELPERGAVLDRLEAMKGYTFENTRLLCRECDQKLQDSRGYR